MKNLMNTFDEINKKMNSPKTLFYIFLLLLLIGFISELATPWQVKYDRKVRIETKVNKIMKQKYL